MLNKITIVLPVFNNIESLDNTLSSILDQTYKNFDVIIIDDNSTDGSSEILKKFADKYDFFYKKIYTDYESKFINGINTDTGTSACNEALKYANTDWVVTIGDEILLKNTMEIIFNLTKLFNYDHLILDVLNISKKQNSTLRKKKFDYDKFVKKNGLQSISTNNLVDFANSQIGIINKLFPKFSSKLKFKFKNTYFIKKLFYKNFLPLPGNAGGAIINKRIYKKIKYNYVDQRVYPSFNGRGTDRDYNLRIITKFKNSLKIALPILPSNMDHKIDNEIIDKYLID